MAYTLVMPTSEDNHKLALFFSRFLPKIRIDVLSECWNWQASKKESGYGLFDYKQASVSAHRFAYSLLVGQIPRKLELDHLCRNRSCVNPWHMEPVTHKENMRRGVSLQTLNSLKTHCKHGHELTGPNLIIDTRGNRQCRECHRRLSMEYVIRKRLAV